MSATAARGDLRRAALLDALEDHLRDASLDDINVADLTRRAGVTRSAFYFYFDNKAAAVAALMAEMYDEALDAAELLGGDGAFRDRIEAAIRRILAGWERRTHLHRAMLEARAASPVVDDQWEADQQEFVRIVADVIESERAAGLAPPGPSAVAIATALLDLNDRALARLVRGSADLDWPQHVEAVVHLWLTGIYGSAR